MHHYTSDGMKGQAPSAAKMAIGAAGGAAGASKLAEKELVK